MTHTETERKIRTFGDALIGQDDGSERGVPVWATGRALRLLATIEETMPRAVTDASLTDEGRIRVTAQQGGHFLELVVKRGGSVFFRETYKGKDVIHVTIPTADIAVGAIRRIGTSWDWEGDYAEMGVARADDGSVAVSDVRLS